MATEWSDQYRTPSVIAEEGMSGHDIIAECRRVGAVYYEDGPDDECFVVTMRPNIGPEIWTKRALGA